jgi:hypothetical protein
VAERLGLYPELPSGSTVEEYRGVGGVVVRAFVVKESVKVEVIAEGRGSPSVEAVNKILS